MIRRLSAVLLCLFLGSPFEFNVSGPAPPDPSKVRVRGPGVANGILANFQSRFFVDTEGAGAGNLSVKMRGPKGELFPLTQHPSLIFFFTSNTSIFFCEKVLKYYFGLVNC